MRVVLSRDCSDFFRRASRRASEVGERLPYIGGIFIPRYRKARSVFVEERARGVFFAAVAMKRNIGLLCLNRKPNASCRVAEQSVRPSKLLAWPAGEITYPNLWCWRSKPKASSKLQPEEGYRCCCTASTDISRLVNRKGAWPLFSEQRTAACCRKTSDTSLGSQPSDRHQRLDSADHCPDSQFAPHSVRTYSAGGATL